MTGAKPIDRELYTLLVLTTPAGIHRDQLASTLQTPDRTARGSVERTRILAARNPHPNLGKRIIGFDPQSERYVDAQDADQAQRVMAYLHSRLEAHLEGLRALVEAYRERFGELPEQARDIQESLFEAESLGVRLPEVPHA